MNLRRPSSVFYTNALIALASILVWIGCSQKPRLTDEERARIHPQIQRLLAGEQVPELEEFSAIRAEGSREFPLIVRMGNPDELASIGINPQSRFGELVTVRVTKEEIVKIARLPSVIMIEPSSRNYPQDRVD
jgi:hypothetical protein